MQQRGRQLHGLNGNHVKPVIMRIFSRIHRQLHNFGVSLFSYHILYIHNVYIIYGIMCILAQRKAAALKNCESKGSKQASNPVPLAFWVIELDCFSMVCH